MKARNEVTEKNSVLGALGEPQVIRVRLLGACMCYLLLNLFGGQRRHGANDKDSVDCAHAD